MTTTTRKPKRVSFEFGEPVTREEVENANVGISVPHDAGDIWEFTTIERKRLSEIEAENHRLRDEHQRLNLTIYDLEREKQRLELELLAAKNALMMAGVERAA